MSINTKKEMILKSKKREAIYNLESRKNYFDSGKIQILNNFLISDGILLLYYTQKPFCLGCALFDKKDNELIYRTANPIFTSEEQIEKIESEIDGDKITIFFIENGIKKEKSFSLNYILGKERDNSEYNDNCVKCIIEKYSGNPIISPNCKNNWEACGTFNPAIIDINGTIHILYRAVGNDGSSVIGYAVSKDGIHIDERLPYPIYKPTSDFELRNSDLTQPIFQYSSGGTCDCWGGCEDPRVAKIGDTIYMIYTAFNGVNPPCVAMTSIKVSDFIERKWGKWKKPVLVSPKNQMNKNWVIFPEKINGKYAIMHSITPNIQVEYLDSLDFLENPNIKSTYMQVKKKGVWDNIIRGVGPTPLKIDEGWLIFYHAISEKELGKYKIGAMILDYKDPTKILYKSTFPVIEPDKKYENEGFKGGIVYTCGATIKDENLILYYGGADTVVCVASCNLKEFIKQIKDNNGKI